MEAECIKGAWSSVGTSLIKDSHKIVNRVNSMTDLVPFGYVPPVDKPDAPQIVPVVLPGVAVSTTDVASSMQTG